MNKTAWFVGSGLAALAGAAFLIRDGQMPGKQITILEQQQLPGGALDGIKEPKKGFVIRGGREMEEHFECLWDLYRSIPSLEIEGASVLDEFYWLNKDDPNSSLQRATMNRGEDAHTDGLFTLSEQAQKEIVKLFLATREEMENKRIHEVFGTEFLNSNFWLYWRTMFAFEEWHSALEMKLYLHRFIHQIKGMPDFSTLKFTKYNQYESLVLPLVKWLLDHGVVFHYGTEVTDVDFDIAPGRKQATRIHWRKDAVEGGVDLGADDLVFITIGSLTENSDNGDHYTPAKLNTGPAPAWDLWRRIAAKDPAFGHPDVFGAHIPETKWESATVTTLDARIPKYIQKIAKRDPFSGKVVTGGIVTAKDSSWLLSWTVNRQPHFKQQPKDQIVVWVYALFVEQPGDYVKKPMQDCSGEEITQEWLYHLGVPVEAIPELAATGAITIPVMMPYVTAFFMPRQAGDRPDVVPAERGQLRLHWPVRAVQGARLHLHHRVFGANTNGSGLHTARRRARRTRSLQLHLRHPDVFWARPAVCATARRSTCPGACVPAQAADEQARQDPDWRPVARIRTGHGRLTPLPSCQSCD
jgi:oleate hydratase